jgi:glutamate 5-kinase
MTSPTFRFFISFIVGAALLILLSGCGGSFQDDPEDQNSEEEIKTTQPVNCNNNPTCR